MIALSLAFSFRSVLGRVGLAPTHQRGGRSSGLHLRRWQGLIAGLEARWTTSYLAWRSEIPSEVYTERVPRFCRDCDDDTPHEGFDELGIGWYAQIYRCRYCGGQSMRVWPLAQW